MTITDERLRELIDQIKTWSQAYPISVFPEPDMARSHEVLKAAELSVDRISAAAMRHVITEVAKIIAPLDDLAAALADLTSDEWWERNGIGRWYDCAEIVRHRLGKP